MPITPFKNKFNETSTCSKSINALANQAIGIFDSGLGGLSVARHIKALLPHERLIYIADSAFAPYGCKTQSQIEQRSIAIRDLLVEKQVKAIVVACNTATVSAIKSLRANFHLPIIGIEPGVKPAVQNENQKVAILTTAQTSKSDQLASLIARFGHNTQVIVQPCPGLVEQVELMSMDAPKTKALLSKFLTPLKLQQVSCVVLGCTHYPFLADQIADFFDYPVDIIDTGPAVAREVSRRLHEAGTIRTSTSSSPDIFYATGSLSPLSQMLSEIWQAPFDVEKISL